jgi:hypothetical protein
MILPTYQFVKLIFIACMCSKVDTKYSCKVFNNIPKFYIGSSLLSTELKLLVFFFLEQLKNIPLEI